MATFTTSRSIAATPSEIFAAISHPERLARWWGPAGFTNTFRLCEFRNGGKWSFDMHAPDGRSFPNESIFTAIDEPTRVVIDHVCEPRFQLTITLTATADGTTVGWLQQFANAEMAQKLAAIVVPANEQNLDRLTAEVLGSPAA